jgi:hypothetical protein
MDYNSPNKHTLQFTAHTGVDPTTEHHAHPQNQIYPPSILEEVGFRTILYKKSSSGKTIALPLGLLKMGIMEIRMLSPSGNPESYRFTTLETEYGWREDKVGAR